MSNLFNQPTLNEAEAAQITADYTREGWRVIRTEHTFEGIPCGEQLVLYRNQYDQPDGWVVNHRWEID
jgi:hypothetical protein